MLEVGSLVLLLTQVAGLFLMFVMALPRLMKISKALRKHLGQTGWNILFGVLCVVFLAWGGFSIWVAVTDVQHSRRMFELIAPLFEQAAERANPVD